MLVVQERSHCRLAISDCRLTVAELSRFRLGFFLAALPPSQCGKVYLTGRRTFLSDARLSLAAIIKTTSVGKASLTALEGGKPLFNVRTLRPCRCASEMLAGRAVLSRDGTTKLPRLE